MNLFASFAANNSLWLLWYRVVLDEPEVIEQNVVSFVRSTRFRAIRIPKNINSPSESTTINLNAVTIMQQFVLSEDIFEGDLVSVIFISKQFVVNYADIDTCWA